MSEGRNVHLEVQVLCEAHSQAMHERGLNEVAFMNTVSAAAMDRIIYAIEQPLSPEKIERAIREFLQRGSALCCFLGEEFVRDAMQRCPKTMGSYEKDAEIAEMIEPRMEREGFLPELNTYTQVPGSNFYLHFAEDPNKTSHPKGPYIVMVTEGHPKEGDTETAILSVERVHDQREAQRWFRETMNTKPWLNKS